jgi:NADH dehydrogenase
VGLIAGCVTEIRHRARTLTVQRVNGAEHELHYDTLAVTAGAATRNFPSPASSNRRSA